MAVIPIYSVVSLASDSLGYCLGDGAWLPTYGYLFTSLQLGALEASHALRSTYSTAIRCLSLLLAPARLSTLWTSSPQINAITMRISAEIPITRCTISDRLRLTQPDSQCFIDRLVQFSKIETTFRLKANSC